MTRRQFLGILATVPLLRPASLLADVVPITQCEAFKKEFNPYLEKPMEKFLDSIAARETGYNPHKIGKKGERSMYQMKEETWERYTPAPFYLASLNPSLAHGIAREHFAYLFNNWEWPKDSQFPWVDVHRSPRTATGGLDHRPLAGQVYYLALAWHYGLEGMHKHGSNDEYALAIERLFLS